MVEHSPDPGFASPDHGKHKGCIGIGEAEFFILAVKPSFGAGKGDDIF
jgi:hypothetical protein